MSSEPRLSFEFKPAPIRRAVRVEIVGSHVVLSDADGQAKDEIDLRQAADLNFAEITTRDTTTRWLDVDHPGGRFRIACNTLGTDVGPDADRDEFRAASAAVLHAVEHVVPGIEVTIGTRGRMRWAYFGLGVAALAVGLGLPLAALATGVRMEKLVAGLLPSGLLLLMGLFLTAAYRPWLPAPRVPASQLAMALMSPASPTDEEARG